MAANGVELATAYVALTVETRDIAKDVSKSMAPVEKEAAKTGKKAGGAFNSGMKGMLGGLSGMFAGALAGIGIKNLVGEAIAEARESQKVGALTTSIIKSTGGAAKITADQVGDLATAISNKTGMDDEAIQTGANLLLTFKNVRNEVGKGNDIFNQATKAAVDLSAAGFGSVDGASKMLGKALNDPIKGISALGRAGVTFTDQQKEQIKTLVESGDTLSAQKMIMAELNSQVGGAAEATATAGEKAAVTFGNLKEQAGTYLLPVIDSLATSFIDLVTGIQQGTGFGGQLRDVFQQTVGFVSALVGWVIEYQGVLLPLGAAIGVIVAGIKVWTLVTKAQVAITAAWTAVQAALNVVMNANPIGIIIIAITALVAAIVVAYKRSETFRKVVDAVWRGVKAAIGAVVDWFRNTAWPWVRDVLEKLKLAFTVSKDAVVGAWNKIRDGISAGWNWVRDKVFTPFKSGLGLLATKFGEVKDAIGKKWKQVQDLAKAPIKFVIETVLNNGLIAGFNWISSKIGGPKVNPIPLPKGFKTGGVLPGYTPGRDVHRFVSPTGGILDLSGGEGILIPQVTKALGGAAGIAALNSGDFSALGQHAYAGGGVIDWLLDKASSVYKAVSNPLAYLKSKLPKMPGGFLGELSGGVRDRVLGFAVDKLKGLWSGFQKTATNGIGSNAFGWQELWSIVHRLLPGIQLTSAYRPGAITALGNKSLHGMGRAIDVAPPSMAAFNTILKAFPNATQLFYGPADGRTLLNGRPWKMDPVTKANHYDHIHLAMARGGVIPTFDSGGTLRPGLNVVNNATGADEVLRPVGRGSGPVYVNIDVSQLRDLATVADFLALIDAQRVDTRRVMSGKVNG